MKGSVLVINSGSSSLKFASFDIASGALPQRVLHGAIDGLGGAMPTLRAWGHDDGAVEESALPAPADADAAHECALQALLDWLRQHPTQGQPLGVAHRVVHGGEQFTQPVLLTPAVQAELHGLERLAPLHQPHNLAAVRAIATLMPGLPQLAGFDTAFHASQQWVAQAYALPQAISRSGIRRYGFHGISYEYIAGRLPEHLGAAAEGRVVVAHLGNGASLCAMKQRRSVASSMGYTALDGLMMGTRCGSLDPGVVLHLITQLGMPPAQVEQMLYQQSGLLGVSGISADMRVLLASDAPDAAAAVALFVHAISRELGAMAAELGGLDALVFTAGIGEHSAEIRRRVCEQAAWLGVAIDDAANAAVASARPGEGRCISAPGSRTKAWVIPTDEEWMLARHAQALLIR